MVIDLVAIAIFHLGIGIAEPSKIPRSHQSHFIIYCVYIYTYIYIHIYIYICTCWLVDRFP